jgi:hypothetical protein
MITNVLSLQYIVVYYDILSDMSIYIAIVDRVLSYTSKHIVKGDIDKWRRVNIYSFYKNRESLTTHY